VVSAEADTDAENNADADADAAVQMSTRAEYVLQALRNVPLLRKLTEADRARLADVLVEQQYGPGETIVRQGEESTGFYIVATGDLIVTRRNKPNEKSMEIGRLGCGDFFGEAGLLSKAPRGATVSVAMTSHAVVLFLDRDHFFSMFSTEHLNIQFAKRQGVSGEDSKADAFAAASGGMLAKIPKDAVRTKTPLQTALILRAIQDNVLFSGLDNYHREMIVKEMWRAAFRRGDNAIVQGDYGDNIYIVESGEFGVYVDGKRVATRGKGTVFGELALLYNSPRKATVTALVDSVVWVVDRFTFRRIVTDLSERRYQLYVQFLQRVSLLQPLSQFERSKIAEALEEVTVKAGQVVCKQGSPGDCMYLVYSGTLIVTKTETPTTSGSHRLVHYSSSAIAQPAASPSDNSHSLGSEFAAATSLAQQAVSGHTPSQSPISPRVVSTGLTSHTPVSHLANAGSSVLGIDPAASPSHSPTAVTATPLGVAQGGHFTLPAIDVSAPFAVNRISPGGYFGERALLTNEPRAATVTAETDCRLLRLDRNAFVLLLGPLQEIMKSKMRDDETFEQAVRSSPVSTPQSFNDVKRLGKYPSSMQLTPAQSGATAIPSPAGQALSHQFFSAPHHSQQQQQQQQPQQQPHQLHLHPSTEQKSISADNLFMTAPAPKSKSQTSSSGGTPQPTTPTAITQHITPISTTSSGTTSATSALGTGTAIPTAATSKKLVHSSSSASSTHSTSGSTHHATSHSGFVGTHITSVPEGTKPEAKKDSDKATTAPPPIITSAQPKTLAPARTSSSATDTSQSLSPRGLASSNKSTANAKYLAAMQAAGPGAQAKGLPWTGPTGVSKGFMPIPYSDLKVVGTLGKGSFGYVQLVQDVNSGHTYALKAVSKTQIVETSQQGHILSEKRTMLRLNHPFLVRLYQTYKDKNRLFFLLDPVLGGELFTLLRSRYHFDEDTARFYAAAVVLGFEYMHDFNIVYRDLKPENLLIDADGYIKIADFGFAKDIGETGRTWTTCGTPDYLAPEVVNSLGHGKGVDWWTLGVFIYEMLVAYPPFYDEDPMRTYARIVEGVVDFPTHLSSEAVSLIRKLLVAKPTKRLGVVKGGAKLIKIHRWFEDFDWNAMINKQLTPPYIPNIRNATDLSNFDQQHVEPTTFKPYVDDGSNWDEDF